jgi:hypothetical protein
MRLPMPTLAAGPPQIIYKTVASNLRNPMSKLIFSIFLLVSINIYGQKSEIEELINQIAKNEVPENFDYYFVVSKSLEQPKIFDSIQNYHIEEFRTTDKDVILNLYYENNKERTDWKNYDLKNTKFVIDEYKHPTTSPPTSKNVHFVKYNINRRKYDSLLENRKPQTLIVKKKWFWNKKRIWSNKNFHKELLKAWEIDNEKNPEENIYFEFSKPIFSADKKYAKVSVFKNRRCNGGGFTALYKNVNGIWKNLIAYNPVGSVTTVTHSRCGDMSISIYD